MDMLGIIRYTTAGLARLICVHVVHVPTMQIPAVCPSQGYVYGQLHVHNL